jgi:hypothetical protein
MAEMAAALRLVRDDGTDGQVPSIEAYQLYLVLGDGDDLPAATRL